MGRWFVDGLWTEVLLAPSLAGGGERRSRRCCGLRLGPRMVFPARPPSFLQTHRPNQIAFPQGEGGKFARVCSLIPLVFMEHLLAL